MIFECPAAPGMPRLASPCRAPATSRGPCPRANALPPAVGGAGRVVHVADMPGRMRAYDLRMPDGARHAAVGIAVSRRCDLLVAVAQGKRDASGVRRVALDFLATNRMKNWMIAAMDGR